MPTAWVEVMRRPCQHHPAVHVAPLGAITLTLAAPAATRALACSLPAALRGRADRCNRRADWSGGAEGAPGCRIFPPFPSRRTYGGPVQVPRSEILVSRLQGRRSGSVSRIGPRPGMPCGRDRNPPSEGTSRIAADFTVRAMPRSVASSKVVAAKAQSAANFRLTRRAHLAPTASLRWRSSAGRDRFSSWPPHRQMKHRHSEA